MKCGVTNTGRASESACQCGHRECPGCSSPSLTNKLSASDRTNPVKVSFKELGVARLLRWASTLLKRSGHLSLATHFFGTAESMAPVALPPFDYALALWQDGQRDSARTVLQKILAKVPLHPDANNLLGSLLRK